jgi:diguanylate cyclase (GGDEF)-like protein
VSDGEPRIGGYEENARALAVLFGAGACLAVMSLLLPDWQGRDENGILLPAVLAWVVAGVAWFWRGSMPAAVQQSVLVIGNVLVTLAVAASGPAGPSFALFYVWISLYCFYFHRWTTATGHVFLSGLLYGVVLAGDGFGSLQMARLVLTVGTGLAAGAVVARLVRQVRHLALRDGLTGLANRRAWETGLDDLFVRERRQASLVLIDLDGFKQLNDEHGHLAGDRVLRRAAATWRGVLGDRALVARLGGDEFGVVLPDCELPRALEVAERLRAALDGHTCSVGVASRIGDESPDALLGRADAALYAAKAAGRDRVVAAA